MSRFRKNKLVSRIACLVVAISFISNMVLPASVRAGSITLPAPTQFVQLSGSYSFPLLKGMKFDPSDPLKMQFIIDTADQGKVSQEEAAQLIKYFLAGLTIPESELWVNMSPYEKDKMITQALSETDLGKDLLSQDYILKQISASLTYPESDTGKDYWQKTYQEVQRIAHTTKLPVNTFNKIWIMPDKAVVHENGNFAVVAEASLKTMLDKDYLALKNNLSDIQSKKQNMQEDLINKVDEASSKVMRELILPKINAEVNSGKNFATLRQIYSSLILATWFKKKFKESIYSYYIDKGKIQGIDLADKSAKDKIYNLYVEAFKKGVYNYVKSDFDPATHRNIKRQYFSGGAILPISQFAKFEERSSSAIQNDDLSGKILTGVDVAIASAGSPTDKIARLDKAGEESSGSPLEVRTVGDLKGVVAKNGIDSGMAVLDWNIARKDLEQNKTERIDQSVKTIVSAFDDLGLQYLYVMTHLGRPADESDIQKRFEDFNLAPTVAKAEEILYKNGLNKDIGIVLLPYDLSEAGKVIREAKLASNRRYMFIFDNIRLYPEEQLKADKKASGSEKSDIAGKRQAFEERIIGLTDRSVDKLVYLNEAFDKAHRGEEASMEMAWLFPEENRAAGYNLAENVQAVLDFQGKVTGKLSLMAGGAKFDKYKNFGELTKPIAESGGTIMLVGAQVNPYLREKGFQMGKSKMPLAKEEKDVAVGIKKIGESGVYLITPKDFFVKEKEGSVRLEDLTLDDEQIDIGNTAIKEDVDHIDSLQEGDGLILNGGAGVFDKDWGSKKGTIALVVAANAAAERGVAVFFAGGDMKNALDIVVEEMKTINPAWKLSDKVNFSTGGGSLLTALTKGAANLPPVRAVLKMDTEKSLFNIYSAVKNAFPEGVLLPTPATRHEDTSINGNDANRAAALDLYTSDLGTKFRVIAEGPFAGRSDIFYGGAYIPMVFMPENLPDELRAKIAAAKDAKAVGGAFQEYLAGYLKEEGVGVTTAETKSHKLDVGKIGAAGVDLASLIAIKSPDNVILVFIPLWVKRDYAAIDALNAKIKSDLKEQLPDLADALSALMEPVVWPKEEIDASTHKASFDVLRKYYQLFLADFNKGDFSRMDLLAKAVSNLDAQSLVNPEGIEIDKLLGGYISKADQEAKTPGFGKNVEKFEASLNTLQQISRPMYILSILASKAPDGSKFTDALTGFYARTYRYLLKLSQEHFKEARVMEPARAQIGKYATKLNQLLRNSDAIELNGANADAIIRHLASKGIALSQAEKDNLSRVYSTYANEGGIWCYDILQLAGILSTDNFIASFKHLKNDNPKTDLPSKNPLIAIDGTGEIGSITVVYTLRYNINNNKDPNFIGRFLVRTRSLEGNTPEEKFATAVNKTKQDIFQDPQVKSSGVSLVTSDGKSVKVTDLLAANRLTFEPGNELLNAQLDFQTPSQIPSVYPVNVLLDGKKVGIIWYVDVGQFNQGLVEAFKLEGTNLDNIPRPMIVYEKDGKPYYFGIIIDATPGGVEIGDQQISELFKQKKIKLDGTPLWDFVAKNNLSFSSDKLGDAPEELARLKEILTQVEKDRLAQGRAEQFIYIKAQIPKKLLVPMGAPFNELGDYLQKMPYTKSKGASYISTTSCSTNGDSYVTLALSELAAGFGTMIITEIGPTFHMYTGKDKENPEGHLSPKATGAAKGVAQHLMVNALFTAMRTPTAYLDGNVIIKGGSVFDLSLLLPQNVPQETVKLYLSMIAKEFPEDIKIFSEKDKVNGRYRWEDTITGQSTGSILFDDMIEQIAGPLYTTPVGYDNQWSFSTKEMDLVRQLMLNQARQEDITKLLEAAPLSNTERLAAAGSPIETQSSKAVKELAQLIYDALEAGEDSEGHITKKAILNTITIKDIGGKEYMITLDPLRRQNVRGVNLLAHYTDDFSDSSSKPNLRALVHNIWKTGFFFKEGMEVKFTLSQSQSVREIEASLLNNMASSEITEAVTTQIAQAKKQLQKELRDIIYAPLIKENIKSILTQFENFVRSVINKDQDAIKQYQSGYYQDNSTWQDESRLHTTTSFSRQGRDVVLSYECHKVYSKSLHDSRESKGNITINNVFMAASSAVTSEIADNPGGIDLGAIDVAAAPNSVPVKMPPIDLSNLEGFTFQIIRMQPINNLNVIFNTFPKVGEEQDNAAKNKELAYLKN